MDLTEKEIREDIGSLSETLKGIEEKAESEERDYLTDEEQTTWDKTWREIQTKRMDLGRHQKSKLDEELEGTTDVQTLLSPGDMPKGVSVNGHRTEGEHAMYGLVAEIFRAIADPNKGPSEKRESIAKKQELLYKGGHYEDFEVREVEAFNTLVDSSGGIFLPTTISDMIFDIEKQFGVFPDNSLRFPMEPGDGRQIVPNLLGEITFHAVNQGNEANASRFTFSGLALEELKWMAFVPWTNEMGNTAGRRLVELIIRKLGEASANIKDDAVINGDGTSKYHNLKGLDNRSSDSAFPEVRRSTAASGNTAFANITPSDFLNSLLDIAPSLRMRAIFVAHPDWEIFVKDMKDANNRHYYLTGGPVSIQGDRIFVHQRPLLFTEAFPNTDGTSKPYAAAFVPDYLAFADNGRFSTEELTEATIKDENGNDIRLGSQDMRALRVKEFFDFELSSITKTSGGNALGAFTVLETAAS